MRIPFISKPPSRPLRLDLDHDEAVAVRDALENHLASGWMSFESNRRVASVVGRLIKEQVR